jgi:hypothetical protein
MEIATNALQKAVAIHGVLGLVTPTGTPRR